MSPQSAILAFLIYDYILSLTLIHPRIFIDLMLDFGVILYLKLSTFDHVIKTSSKAYSVLSMTRHHQILQNVSFICHMFGLYWLEYCSLVWSPYFLTEIASLEKVQRCATKFILDDVSDTCI